MENNGETQYGMLSINIARLSYYTSVPRTIQFFKQLIELEQKLQTLKLLYKLCKLSRSFKGKNDKVKKMLVYPK